MEIPHNIRYASERLKAGYRVNRITVRDFIRHFGAERRGAVIVEEIKMILNDLGLMTDPNFETVWIDEPIWLRLKNSDVQDTGISGEGEVEEIVLESTPSSVKHADEQSESAPTSSEPQLNDGILERDVADPTFRIGSLPAANKQLVTLNQQDGLAKAVTLLMQNDFSQLPVMQSEREVKGVISWKSIALKLAHGIQCSLVGDCLEDARIVEANRTLFDAIPSIVEYGYVLVRQQDRRISGIVTSSDLSLQFQILAEPFLLIREIELHLRRLLSKVEPSELNSFIGEAGIPGRRLEPIANLTIGDYVRLLQRSEIWNNLNLTVHQAETTKLLERVRKIRNDVMHFDPDPMTQEQLETLKKATQFLQTISEMRSLANTALQAKRG